MNILIFWTENGEFFEKRFKNGEYVEIIFKCGEYVEKTIQMWWICWKKQFKCGEILGKNVVNMFKKAFKFGEYVESGENLLLKNSKEKSNLTKTNCH